MSILFLSGYEGEVNVATWLRRGIFGGGVNMWLISTVDTCASSMPLSLGSLYTFS